MKNLGDRKTWLLIRFVAMSFLVVTVSIPARAQIDTGRILGRVTDPSGAVIPGAKITLTNTGTGLRIVSTTGASGYYVFPAVKIGTYQVEIQATGFEKFVRSGITLHVQQDAVVDATLRPGTVTQTVTVKGAAPLLQTQNASLGQTLGTTMVNNLPLNGRNWTVLAQLGAGSTRAASQSSGRPYFSSNGHPLEQNDYRLDGINDNDEAWTLPEPYVALPPPDAIQEFKVETGNYNAEFGHSGGAVVNAIMKSGTNQVHGDLYEFVRNDAFDTANFFENASGLTKGPYQQNQFGGTLGGPVYIPHLYNGKDKTFFFVDYQGTRIRQAQTYIDTVPTAVMRATGYTDLQDWIKYVSGTRTDDLGRTFPTDTAFDPATTRAVTAGQVDPVTGLVAQQSGYVRDPFYQGSLVGVTNFTSPAIESGLNMLPPNRLDPNAIRLLNLYPTPNQPGLFNDFAYNPSGSNNTNQFDFRVDHNFSSPDQIFVTGSHSRTSIFTPGAYPGLAGDAQNFNAGTTLEGADAYAVSETHSFSPTLVNEARLGWSRSPVSIVGSHGNVTGIPAEFGIQGVIQGADNGGLPAINIGGLTPMGTAGWIPTVADSITWDLTENLTKVYGAHTFKAGFEGDYIWTPILQPAFSHGSFDFGGGFAGIPNVSGLGMAQLLLTPTVTSVPGGVSYVGGADNVTATNFAGDSYHRYYYGIYFQDDWKVIPKLTLNLGLRWDHFTPYEEGFGAMSNFIPGAPGRGAEFLIPDKRCSTPLSPSFKALTQKDGIAVQCSSNLALGTVQNLNFAPRLGVAYQLTRKLVARAAYGIFYGALGTLGYGNTLGNTYPFLFEFSYNSLGPASPITFPNGSLGTLETGLSGINFSPAAVNAQYLSLVGRQYNALTPYYEDYNFTLQYQLSPNQTLQLGYVGNQGHHMNTYEGQNAQREIIPPGYNPQNYVPFPDFAAGSAYEFDGAGTYYNSLQATFERRFSGGLDFFGNYTYSKCRSDWRSAALNTVSGYRAPLLPGFGIQGDYAFCDSDTPNVLHLVGLYSLPFGNGRRFLGHARGLVNQLLGGWQTNWILTLQDGYPFSIGCPIRTTGDFGCSALLVPGQNVYAGPHDVNQWLNPAAFRNPPVATAVGQSNYAPLGGAATQAHGPGEHNLDFSLFKEFPISESKHFEFRAEFFNLTNTPWFANPSFLDFTNTLTFGRINSLQNNSRQIQLALKFYW